MGYLFKSVCILIAGIGLFSACNKNKTSASPEPQVLADVSTIAISGITNNSAKSGGSINYTGTIYAKGVCWNVNQFPSVTDFKTNNGEGTGAFVSNLTELLPNQTYYLRAYATDAYGTVYGNEIKFTTDVLASVVSNGAKMYVHPTDNGASNWGPAGEVSGANSPADGSANTKAIALLANPHAAKVCADLVAYGYSDWYLPSVTELELMYLKKVSLGMTAPEYWTSTETDAFTAYSENFLSGNHNSASTKDNVYPCRCVRKDP